MDHSPKLADELRSKDQVRAEFLEKSRDATLRALRWTSRGNFDLSRYWWGVSERYERQAKTLGPEPEQIACPRCGQEMVDADQAEGCEDWDCPLQ